MGPSGHAEDGTHQTTIDCLGVEVGAVQGDEDGLCLPATVGCDASDGCGLQVVEEVRRVEPLAVHRQLSLTRITRTILRSFEAIGSIERKIEREKERLNKREREIQRILYIQYACLFFVA